METLTANEKTYEMLGGLVPVSPAGIYKTSIRYSSRSESREIEMLNGLHKARLTLEDRTECLGDVLMVSRRTFEGLPVKRLTIRVAHP